MKRGIIMRWIKILSILIALFAFSLGVSNAQHCLILSGVSMPAVPCPLKDKIIADFDIMDYCSLIIHLRPPAKVTLQFDIIASTHKATNISA